MNPEAGARVAWSDGVGRLLRRVARMRVVALLIDVLDTPLALFWLAAARIYAVMYGPGNAPSATHRELVAVIPMSSLEALQQKGNGLHGVYEKDLDGYFQRVHIQYFPTSRSGSTVLAGRFAVTQTRPWLPGGRLSCAARALWNVLHIVSQRPVACLQGSDTYLHGLVAVLAARWSGRPCAISIHSDNDVRFRLNPANYYVLYGSHGLMRRVERWVLRHADRVWPIRESLAQRAVQLGAPEASVRVMPHGIDLAPFRGTPPSQPGSGPRVLFVGRLARDNYVDDVLEIADRIRRRRPDARVVLAGTGQEEARLRLAVRRRGLSDHVQLLGAVPRERALRMRCEAAVNLCLMGGFSLIEAAASGRPVVAYDVEWHRELIRDGDTGRLAPEHDVEAAARAVLDLLERPEEAAALGRAARELALARHDLVATQALKRRYADELIGCRAGRVADFARKIEERNPWYVGEQLQYSESPAARHAYDARRREVRACVEAYCAEKARRSDVLVADVGCGDGVMTETLADTGACVLGIDANHVRLSRLANRWPMIRVMLSDGTQLGLADRCVDVLIASHVLEHIPDDIAACREFRRVLKPQGLLVLGVPNEGCVLGRLRNTIVQPSIARETDHVHWYTASQLRQRLALSGFAVERVWRESFMIPCTHVYDRCAASSFGRRVIRGLGRLFPGQCGGLFAVCRPAAGASESFDLRPETPARNEAGAFRLDMV